ncbi:hypothetical protein RND81_09G212600 [Saponaria officinalis]|uniref:Phosphatidylinositol 4-phosphate 5-kinase n=1 Tax=Saponaria officinalis TaxID=3572 RepID=A0AAW1IQT4_SAPOF
MTTAQHQHTLPEKPMKFKSLRRSQTFCIRAHVKSPHSSSNDEDYVEEDYSSSEEDNPSSSSSSSTTTTSNTLVAAHRNSKSQPSLRRITPVSIDLGKPPSPEYGAGGKSGKGSLKLGKSTSSEYGGAGGEGDVERVLANGDLYTGGFMGNAPHGRGKYLWGDGCMYEGEWRKGKAWGKGKFSWPSGATYEGGFKGGRMDGFGTYIGTEGDTYRGAWAGDKKHGRGEKLYANGDTYEGEWKDNLQHGEGKYVWKNGNVYVGEWRNGVIFGNGVLIWANGNKYQGCWEAGVPNGAGVFTRPDGTTYAGNWGNNDNCNDNDVDCAIKKVNVGAEGEKRGVEGGRTSVSERGVNFPRLCIWEADDDITCDIIHSVEAQKLYREGSLRNNNNNKSPKHGTLSRSASPSQWSHLSPRPYWCGGGGDEVKKPGHPICRGHKNYELMLNLQLGIRHIVGKHAMKARALKTSDFEPSEKNWTRFPPEGSKHTPPHQSVDFKWKDYCPTVFRHLRELFGIDPAEYMLAICGSDALREFSSPGKSGCCFYLTQDDRYMIKTVKKAEVKVLLKMLPKYYEHVSKHRNTLVTKFFGMHCVKPAGGQKTRFIVMGNLFHSEYRIHKRFDLKGSSHGRSIDKPEGEIDENTTLKDLDLKFVFRLQPSLFQELMRQVDRDCEFLEAEKIMDYSLLIGLHFRDDSPGNERAISPTDRPYQDISSSQGYDMFTSEMLGSDWMTDGNFGKLDV